MVVDSVSSANQQQLAMPPTVILRQQKNPKRTLKYWIIGSCALGVLIAFFAVPAFIDTRSSASTPESLADVEEKEQLLPYRVQLEPPISGQRARSIHVIGKIAKNASSIEIVFESASNDTNGHKQLVFSFDFSQANAIMTISLHKAEHSKTIPEISRETRFAAGEEFDIYLWFLSQKFKLLAGPKNDELIFDEVLDMEVIDKVTVTGSLSVISSFRYGAHYCREHECSLLLDNKNDGLAYNLHFAGIAIGGSVAATISSIIPEVHRTAGVEVKIDVDTGEIELSVQDFDLTDLSTFNTYLTLVRKNQVLAAKFLEEHVNSSFRAVRQADPVGRNQFFDIEIVLQTDAVAVRYENMVVAQFEMKRYQYIGRGPFQFVLIGENVVLDAYCIAVGFWGQTCMENSVNSTLGSLKLKH